MSYSMTHKDLVQLAAKWLEKEHSIVVTEMSSDALIEPDAIGFKGGHWSTMVECKVSRADFFANRHKPEIQMGARRYFLTPVGLVEPAELPPKWGLLHPNGRGTGAFVLVPAEPFAFDERDVMGEVTLLVSCLRRIGQQPRPDAISVKCYSYQTKNRATLGIEIGGGNGNSTKSRHRV